MHSRCDKQHEMSMHMMLCSSFSASKTRGVTNTSRLSCRNRTSVLSYLSSRLKLMMVVLRSSANPRLIFLVSSVGRIEVTTCNASNFRVNFFSFLHSPNSGVTLSFFLFSLLSLDLFQSYSEIRLEISCK
jgi:hypothetical protein